MGAEDRKDVEEVAEEMQAEVEKREAGRLEEERTDQEDLNQGMVTGTHSSIHRGVNWPRSYTVRTKPPQ